MYGMVNRALQELLVKEHGESTWHRIKDEAGVDLEEFSSMASYDDKITYDLAIAASKVLEAPLDQLLDAFGRYWVEFAKASSYAILLEQAGKDLHEILPMLNELHTRLALSFPELQPPSFEVLEDTPEHILLQYDTFRPALAPFVVGLLHGLAEMVGTPIKVDHVQAKGDEHDADVFKIRFVSA